MPKGNGPITDRPTATQSVSTLVPGRQPSMAGHGGGGMVSTGLPITSIGPTVLPTSTNLRTQVILNTPEILSLGDEAESLVGGKNANAAIISGIEGLSVPAFRAVSATAFHRLLDETMVDARSITSVVDSRMEAVRWDEVLADPERARDFQKEFVLETGREMRASSEGMNGDAITLRQFIAQTLEGAEDLSIDELRRRSILVQSAILSLEPPRDITDGIAQAYDDICKESGQDNVLVAVRSSAAGEDSADAAFAGLQDTYLNIRGRDAVVESWVRDCASAYNVRSLSYRLDRIAAARVQAEREENQRLLDQARERYGIEQTSLSVCLMRMVQPQSAGVAFSCDPATGFRGGPSNDLVAIDASWGLGEAIVGGGVTPDHFNVWTTPRGEDVVAQRMGVKAREYVPTVDGTGSQLAEVPADRLFTWSLLPEQAVAVAQGVRRITAEYKGIRMDTEFVIERGTGRLWFVQARPETKWNVAERENPGVISMRRQRVKPGAEKGAEVLLKGMATSPGAGVGTVRFLNSALELSRVSEGDVLAAERTDPDMVPGMRKASAIVADVGGVTSHAAITSRELGKPAVIGIESLVDVQALDGEEVTVDGSAGKIYRGKLPLEMFGRDIDVATLPSTRMELGLILADGGQAWKLSPLRAEPGFKVGLFRAEFVLGDLRAHVVALEDYDRGRLNERIERRLRELNEMLDKRMKDLGAAASGRTREELASLLSIPEDRNITFAQEIAATNRLPETFRELIERSGYSSGREYYVHTLAQRIAEFGLAFSGRDVVYRTTDFKTNEYAGLMGGRSHEPVEDNAMLGHRGIGRGVHDWEAEAFKLAREHYGATNVHLMYPFARTVNEVRAVKQYLNDVHGLASGVNGLKVILMFEIPNNALLAPEFIAEVDGFSIGSNDMTQTVLATDRDNQSLQHTYDEEDPGVIETFLMAIFTGQRYQKEVGFCGQGVTNSEIVRGVVAIAGITSASVIADTYLQAKEEVAALEQQGLQARDLGRWLVEKFSARLVRAMENYPGRAYEGDNTPARIYEHHRGVLTETLSALKDARGTDREDALRAQYQALRKLDKFMIYANTDWDTIVERALHHAGFNHFDEQEEALAQFRAGTH